tara:strand:- start:827 stop:1618 length:792 start_codon:yes stop_codon:yes gene_type:complete
LLGSAGTAVAAAAPAVLKTAATTAAVSAVGRKLLPDVAERPFLASQGVEVTPPTGQPPASEGGAVRGDAVTVPAEVSQDIIDPGSTNIINIPYGGEFMAQQPVMQGGAMLGSPMVYSRVADIARQLANRGRGLGGIATGVGLGGLVGGMLGPDGKPLTIPQQVKAVTGMPFTRKTQAAYKNLAELTGLQNAAACLGIPEQLFCQAMIHRFPTRRRGISAAQLRTAKRVNGTIARMHKELSSEFKGATRRAPARRSSSTVIQNS